MSTRTVFAKIEFAMYPTFLFEIQDKNCQDYLSIAFTDSHNQPNSKSEHFQTQSPHTSRSSPVSIVSPIANKCIATNTTRSLIDKLIGLKGYPAEQVNKINELYLRARTDSPHPIQKVKLRDGYTQRKTKSPLWPKRWVLHSNFWRHESPKLIFLSSVESKS